MNFFRLNALTVLLGFGAVACTAPGSDGSGSLDGERFDADGLFSSGAIRDGWNASIVRARSAEPRFDVTAGGQPRADADIPTSVRLNLFEDARYDARLIQLRGSGSGMTWEGALVDGAGTVSLSVVDGMYAGTVRADGKLFQIGHRGSAHFIAQLDELGFEEHAPIVPDMPAVVSPAPDGPVTAADVGDTQIDIMVVYTAEAMVAAAGANGSGAAAMAAVVDLAISETNQGYTASGVGIHLNLVYQGAVDYDEANFDWGETLTRLQAGADGFMDEVHDLRDQVGADHVVLLVDTVGPYAGIGYQMQAITAPFFADYAFAVVARDYATGAYTFAHELGHNMGANHDRDNADQGFFDDSFGLQVPEAGFRTVMAYSCSGCVRVNRWSNPLITYNNAPTGIVDDADNARTLNQTKAITAAFRSAAVGPPTDIASMVSPNPGTTLGSDTATFTWEDAGALGYRLAVSNAVGDTLHDQNYAQNTTATVGGLPLDSSTLSVRLWSQTQTAGWQYNDYSYTAYQPPPQPIVPSVIAAPVPGSRLLAGDVSFAWPKSEGADQYRLQVGTTAAPAAYFDTTFGQVTGTTVVGLPEDGSAIVATLWSHGPVGWLTTQAQYTAHSAQPAPKIVWPIDGNTLSGSAQTFVWQSLGASQYWLTITRTDGSYLFSGSMGTGTQFVFSALPTDGSEIQVTLYAEFPFGWLSWAATYTTATP